MWMVSSLKSLSFHALNALSVQGTGEIILLVLFKEQREDSGDGELRMVSAYVLTWFTVGGETLNNNDHRQWSVFVCNLNKSNDQRYRFAFILKKKKNNHK